MIIITTHAAQAPTSWQKLYVDEMAAAMQDMDAVGEPITPENLRLRGYSNIDICRYGLSAANLARKRITKVALA